MWILIGYVNLPHGALRLDRLCYEIVRLSVSFILLYKYLIVRGILLLTFFIDFKLGSSSTIVPSASLIYDLTLTAKCVSHLLQSDTCIDITLLPGIIKTFLACFKKQFHWLQNTDNKLSNDVYKSNFTFGCHKKLNLAQINQSVTVIYVCALII